MAAAAALDARVKLVCLMAYFVLALQARSAIGLGLCVAAALAAAVAARLAFADIWRVVRPFLAILLLTALMQILCYQQGNVLAHIGDLVVTDEAAALIGRMLASFLGIMTASIAFMHCTSPEQLVSALQWMLTPLRSHGARTEGFMFSASVAFRFVPVLVEEFWRLKHAQQVRGAAFQQKSLEALKAYSRLFAPLMRSAFRRADVLAEASVSRCLGCGAKPSSLHAFAPGAREAALLLSTALLAVCVVLL